MHGTLLCACVYMCMCVCVVVCVVVLLLCLCVQGIDPAVIARFPEWRFDKTHVIIRPNPPSPATPQPTALRNTLQQLHAMQTAPGSHCVVEMAEWSNNTHTWPDALLQIVSNAVPQLPHLDIGVRIGKGVVGKGLSALLRAGQNIRHVSARHADVGSNEYKDAPWAWEEMWFTALVHAPELLMLPRPRGGEAGPSVVRCNDLTFHSVTEQVRVYTHHTYTRRLHTNTYMLHVRIYTQ